MTAPGDLSYREARAAALRSEADELAQSMGWLHRMTLLAYRESEQTND